MSFTVCYRGKLRRSGLLRSVNNILANSLHVTDEGKSSKGAPKFSKFSAVSGKLSLATNLASLLEESCDTGVSDFQMGSKKKTLAVDLASLLEESCEAVDRKKPKSRIELKKYLENRIKKKVKEHYVDGKFRDLMEKVIANPETLRDAYDCIRLNSNVDIMIQDGKVSYESMSEELCSGKFDVAANTVSFLERHSTEEVLVLPNLKLKVLQEALRVALEVVYRPHFSKISHGCRSGRGHISALRFIKKDIPVSDWWFTVSVNKKIDTRILNKLISLMEEKIEDQNLFSIIRSMFFSQVLNLEFGGFPKGHGLPQEGILSPILMNIYLDLFDREFYRLSMKYEALGSDSQKNQTSQSKLRSWFRRDLKANHVSEPDDRSLNSRVYSCRYMDEMFFAVSSSKDVALGFKSEILDYLKESLHLDIVGNTRLLPCKGRRGIHIMGTLVRKVEKESPALRAIHKLKEKVELLALQREEAWCAGTNRIGKKWLAHGLKKVKESEIKQLADPDFVLSKISRFRKPGMITDHWYKHLLRIWLQDIDVKKANSEKHLISMFIVEPALPKELTDSFYEFQRHAKEYVSSETASTNALMQSSELNAQPIIVTQVNAPTDTLKKELSRYKLATVKGDPRACALLTSLDDDQIIDWYSGIVRRWLRWYSECDNFSDIKLLICNHIRMSCIRTLASKHRVHGSAIEKKMDDELSRIPSHEDFEVEMVNEPTEFSKNTEALMYGISYSGLCMLSLARTVSKSSARNCSIVGCLAPALSIYKLHIMERQKFPGWKTGFPSCIHSSLNEKRFGLCINHLKDLALGHISLQSVDFGSSD